MGNSLRTAAGPVVTIGEFTMAINEMGAVRQILREAQNA
jgi:hypothetical protein